MRAFLLIILILANDCVYAAETYVLIDAVVFPSEAMQPKWIALDPRGGGEYIHVPVGESIVAIEQGTYSVKHIDFQENHQAPAFDTAHLPLGRETIKFETVPDSITYVGIIALERAGWGSSGKRWEISLISSKKILGWACDKKPETLSRLPVHFPGQINSAERVRIRCET